MKRLIAAVLIWLGLTCAALAQAQYLTVAACGAKSLPVNVLGTAYMDTTGNLCTNASGGGGGGGVVTQPTPSLLNATVVGTGTFATQASQTGTWTVQPGNTANTTPWLVTGTGGAFPITWPGSAAVTNYGTTPTGTVPAVNSFCTNCATVAINPFNPSGNVSNQTVTSSSVSYALPTGSPTSVIVDNLGNNQINIAFGTSPTVTATTGQPVQPDSWKSFAVPAGATSYAVISVINGVAGGTSVVQVSGGSGGATGAGDGAGAAVGQTGVAAPGAAIMGGMLNGSNMQPILGGATGQDMDWLISSLAHADIQAIVSALANVQPLGTNSLHYSSPSLEVSHAIAGSRSLFGFYCQAITGITVGVCVAVNSATVPSPGAITPLDSCYFQSAAGCSFSRLPAGVAYSSGITVLISNSTTPFTYTTGATGFIGVDYN